jgi:hypothetical protein
MTAPKHGHDPAVLLQSLLSESKQLRADVKEREQRNRRMGVLIIVALAVSLVMIVAVVVLLVQSRARSADSRALLRANAETSRRIADCTTAGGQCYEQGAKRSGTAIRQLIQAQVEIAACHQVSDTERELRTCLDDALGPLLEPKPMPAPGPTPAPTPEPKPAPTPTS